jgi:DNA-binding FadR family transcriptional regulator
MKPRNTRATAGGVALGEAASLIVRLLPYVRERRLESGDRLPSERLLAERFGVTRPAVREAMAVLEAMRVVERRPRSGVYLRAEARVGSLDAIVMRTDLGLRLEEEEVDSLNEFRTILEAQAVVLACARRTPEDVARMDDCMSRCRERFRRNESIAQPSADFHLAVVTAAHNQFLLRAANSFYLATREWREALFADRRVCLRSIRDHQAIRDAIAQGRVSRARSAMNAHMQIADHYWHGYLLPRGPSATAEGRRARGSTAAKRGRKSGPTPPREEE